MKITPFLLCLAFWSECFATAKQRRTPSTLLCDPDCGQRDSSKNYSSGFIQNGNLGKCERVTLQKTNDKSINLQLKKTIDLNMTL